MKILYVTFNSLYWIPILSIWVVFERSTRLSILCIGFFIGHYSRSISPFLPFNSLYWIRIFAELYHVCDVMSFQFFVLDSWIRKCFIGRLPEPILSILCIGFFRRWFMAEFLPEKDFQFFVLDSQAHPDARFDNAILNLLSILCIGF